MAWTKVGNLRGPKGATGDAGKDSTVPGPQGPPGAVPTTSSQLVIGPGRPDIPSGTGFTQAQLDGLPVGCVYRSTDGPQGAWEWIKRPTGWTVTDGDTGWIQVTVGFLATGKLLLRRTANNVYANAGQGQYRLFSFANTATAAMVVPAAFRPTGGTEFLTVRADSGKAQTGLLEVDRGGNVLPRMTSTTGSMQAETQLWRSDTPWPTTLP